jgi:ArsR family transcriptional regulator
MEVPLLEPLADVTVTLKALADESRVRIVRVLLHGAFQVGELVSVLDMGQSRVSRHLKILSEAGLLSAQREGTRVFYRLRRDANGASGLVAWLASRLPSVPHPQDDARLHAVWEARRERSRDAFRRAALDWSDGQAAYLGSPDTRAALLSAVEERAQLAVDVGVGTGALLGPLSERCERVIGVDSSAPMLERAREHARGMANVELRLGDVERLPVEDGVADLVVANMVLHHVSEPALAFREFHRALRPGGRLLLGDYTRHDNEWMREELGDQWLGFEAADLSAWLEQAGFARVTIRCIRADSSPMEVFVATALSRG